MNIKKISAALMAAVVMTAAAPVTGMPVLFGITASAAAAGGVQIENGVLKSVPKDITSYSIPSGVTEIGNFAFYKCTNLVNVNIPYGVTKISRDAFNGCTSLASVNIPDSVTEIGTSVFSGCTKLENIIIPGSVKRIEIDAFAGCTGLKNVTMLNGITEIASSAFYGCTGLSSITLPDSLKRLWDRAFGNCDSLTAVTIPKNVEETLGSNPFSYCKNLERINVDPGNTHFTSIDGVLINKDNSKLVCYPLKKGASYTVPEGITEIGTSAFYKCENLTSVILPESLVKIGEIAFGSCIGLKSINIPAAVTQIGFFENTFQTNGARSFSGTQNLAEINVDPKNAVFSSVDGVLFNKNKDELFFYPIGKKDAAYSVPNSVTWIGDNAFKDNKNIRDVRIGNNVNEIGGYAFSGCSNLTNVNIPVGVKTLEKGLFENCSSLNNITIPGSVDTVYAIAFSGCKSLTNVTISNGVQSLTGGAFEKCTKLTSITIPESVTEIFDNTFKNSGLKTIYGVHGSYAEKFAKENGYTFNPISGGGNTSIALKSGDIDGDGIVNVSDVTKIINCALGITPLTGNALKNADINGDGIINIADVVGAIDICLS